MIWVVVVVVVDEYIGAAWWSTQSSVPLSQSPRQDSTDSTHHSHNAETKTRQTLMIEEWSLNSILVASTSGKNIASRRYLCAHCYILSLPGISSVLLWCCKQEVGKYYIQFYHSYYSSTTPTEYNSTSTRLTELDAQYNLRWRDTW